MMRTLLLSLVCVVLSLSLSAGSTQALAHPLVLGDLDGGERPRTPQEVYERLKLIERELGSKEGVASFNHLYQSTTLHIWKALDEGQFEDSTFMTDVTVRFANLYFDAVSFHFSQSENLPHAWRPVFKSRFHVEEIRPVQFAMAGMNAHINRDLPVVLAEMLQDETQYPRKNSARRRDFIRINEELANTFNEMKGELFENSTFLAFFGELGAIPVVRVMREKAWVDGWTLWKLRHIPLAQSAYLEALDRATGIGANASLLWRR